MQEYIQKKEGYGHLLLWLIRLCDLLLINLFFIISYYIAVQYFEQTPYSNDNKLLGLLLINLSYFIVGVTVPIHTSTNIINIERVIRGATTFIVFFCVLTLAFLTLFGLSNNISLSLWVISFVILTILYIILHIFIRLALKSYRRKGYNHRSVVIIGAGESGKAIYNELKNSDFGYKIKGYFNDFEVTDDDEAPEYLGKVSEAKDYILEHKIDEIYCSLDDNQNNTITDLIVFSEKNMIRFFLIPNFFNFVQRRFILRFIESVPVVTLRNEPLQHLPNRFAKRAFDIIFSSLVIIFIFPPVLLIIGSLIKLTSPGPLFFKQERTGFQGENFFCYKFRSMRVNKNADKLMATKDDPRVTKIGAFIRKTSIDELPQFINVIKGEMSVVGPRPHMLKHTEEYSRIIDRYMVRHLVKPGITGWAQVTGYRGETQTIKDMENRVKKDMWYIENWSFLLDLKIIYRTVYNAIRGEEKAY